MSEEMVTEEIVAVAPDETSGETLGKIDEAGRRIARYVSEQVASKGGVARQKAGRASKRAAGSVVRRVREGTSRGGRVALSKLTSAGLKLTEKQQAALKKLKSRYSDS